MARFWFESYLREACIYITIFIQWISHYLKVNCNGSVFSGFANSKAHILYSTHLWWLYSANNGSYLDTTHSPVKLVILRYNGSNSYMVTHYIFALVAHFSSLGINITLYNGVIASMRYTFL